MLGVSGQVQYRIAVFIVVDYLEVAMVAGGFACGPYIAYYFAHSDALSFLDRCLYHMRIFCLISVIMLYNHKITETAAYARSGVRSDIKNLDDRAAVARVDRSASGSCNIQALVSVISAVFLRSFAYKSAV